MVVGRQAANRVGSAGIGSEQCRLAAASTEIDFAHGARAAGFHHPLISPKAIKGVGLLPNPGEIMLSHAYYAFFKDRIPPHLYENMARAMGENVDALPSEKRVGAFITALDKLIVACGMDTLKMSDFGMTKEELPELAKNARETMGGLFEIDRYKLSFDDTVEIYADAFAH